MEMQIGSYCISIHALLAESDLHGLESFAQYVISIHALLAESDKWMRVDFLTVEISIHALLAESDWAVGTAAKLERYFYPRSPCGERRKLGALY